MGFFLASIRKDLQRWWRDAPAILIWLGIPFITGGLITSMIDGQGGGSPTGTLLIADEDSSFVSGMIAGAYSQGELGELIVVEQVSLEEGEQRIAAGEASGFMVIPEGFQDAFLNSEPITLTLKTNPSQTILPGIIQDVTEVLLDAGFYVHEVFGDELAQIQGFEGADDVQDAFVASTSVLINQKAQAISEKLSPLALDLEVVEPPPAEPRPDFALLFFPGIVMMAILFSSNGVASDFWLERDKGTLRRLVSAPGRLGSFVAGKALAAACILGGIAGITLLVGFFYHGVSWAKFIPSLLWVTLGGVGLFAWFAALQMLFPNNKAANLVTTIVLFPLMMAGGSFFPLAALPDWIAAIGALSPNGFIVDRLSTALTSADVFAIDARSWLIQIAITLSGLALCTLRLRTGFARK